jgi:hypothetical protein
MNCASDSAPRSSCRSHDRFGPHDQGRKPVAGLAGSDDLTASFELRDGVAEVSRFGASRRHRDGFRGAGGEHVVRIGEMWSAGHEFVDPIEKGVQHVLIQGLEHMVVARQLDVSGARNIVSQVPSSLDWDERIALAMQDQCRHPDRRQKMADVDLVVRPHQGEDRTRARHGALESAKPLDEGFVFDAARRIEADKDAFTPVGFERRKESRELLGTHGPRGRLDGCIRAIQDEARDSLRRRESVRLADRLDQPSRARSEAASITASTSPTLFERLVGDSIGNPWRVYRRR